MKIKFITLLFIFLQICAFAQSDDINHRKYWYYRSRLCNDFMKIGNQMGESLPMSTRAKYGAYYGTKDGKTETGTDAVSQLGPYICVLVLQNYSNGIYFLEFNINENKTFKKAIKN